MAPIDHLSRRFALRSAVALGVGALSAAAWPFDRMRVLADEETASATPSAADPLARRREVEMAHAHPDEIGVHGMLVTGEKTMYLSHLPMFTDPAHRFQVILEVTLESGGENLQDSYVADRQATGATLYTIQPDPAVEKRFALRELLAGGAQRQAFDVTLFRGHFERGGSEPILAGSVNVKHIVRFQPLDEESTSGDRLEYLLFGGEEELFLAHLITGPPDFDQVLTLQTADLGIPAETLRQGLLVTVPDRENTIADRLSEGETIAVTLTGVQPTQEVSLDIGKELYFEEGELRVPDTFVDTEAEVAAGMP